MGNGTDEAIRLPKNICQIGTADERLKVYFEDYVNVFMKKAESELKPLVGILLGKAAMSGEVPYLFINGAILAENVKIADGMIEFSDLTWTGIQETIEKYFNDVVICGWFLCGDIFWDMDIYSLKKCHRKNFNDSYQILCICGELERTTYCFEMGGSEPLAGYHIYYERNADMQDYMTVSTLSKRIEATVEDRTTKTMRETMQEHRQVKDTRRTLQTSVAIAAAMLVMVIAAGVTMLFGNNNGNTPVGATVQTTESSADSPIVIKNAEGNVNPTQETAPPPDTTPSSEAQSDQVESGETAPPEEGTDAPAETTEPSAESTDPPQETAAPAQAADPKYYWVKEGESLLFIVRTLYGSPDMSKVQEICELNGLANADYIYSGQRLIVP